MASTWYFNLPVGSINSWAKFQKDFLDKFFEETTIGALMAQLFTCHHGPQGEIQGIQPMFHNYPQQVSNRFQALLKNYKLRCMLMHYQTSISMFVKRVAKPTLVENFEEAKIIEFQMKGCKYSHISLSKKETSQTPR
jgi:hypothetical protein